MPADSNAFSSVDSKPRLGEGLNGSLTPARRNRQQQPFSLHHQQKLTNDVGGIPSFPSSFPPPNLAATAAYPLARDYDPSRQAQFSLGDRGGRDGFGGATTAASSALGRVAGGGGISLQETEARIDELERSEFDLKMRLYYTEERLEEAAGGTDALQLHREVAHAKRVSFLFRSRASSCDCACACTSARVCGCVFV